MSKKPITKSSAIKKKIILLLKFVFALGLIYWLVESGKLDFSLLGRSFKTARTEWIITLLLLVTNIIIVNVRWVLLLRVKVKEDISFFKFLTVGWIGLLFNTILPGAVSGDVIKLVYVRKLVPGTSKTFLLVSVILDRIFGLIGLLLLLGIACLISYDEITQISPTIRHVVHFNFLLAAGALIFVISIFMPQRLQEKILSFVSKVPALGNQLQKTFAQVWDIGREKDVVPKVLILSLLGQFISAFSFWILTKSFYDQPMPLLHALCLVPVCMISVAIPITPAGLGLGHAVFETIFKAYGISKGASLFNLHFLGMIFLNTLGIFPYLLSHKAIPQKELDEFSEEELSS